MTEVEARTINEIQETMQQDTNIPASKVKNWMRTESIEVLGAVVCRVIQQSRRIEPPLSMEEICTTVEQYYERCLIENIQNSEYAPNRSIAGQELVSWFQSLWRDPRVSRDYLARLKNMLKDLCIAKKVPVDEIAGAVLEHLFETPEYVQFFADWKSDPTLKPVFDLAMEWTNGSQNLPPV